jgi:mitochondrial intermediate peptidase
MQRVLRLRPSKKWICHRCMSTFSLRSPLGEYSTSGEDALLRAIFDSRQVGASFPKTKTIPTGLFQNKYLTSLGGIKEMSDRMLARAEALTDEITQGKRQETLIVDLDRLSDMLCSVSDLCAFLKIAHPDKEFKEKASETFAVVLEYMNKLNQHEPLYGLCAAAPARSPEEEAVKAAFLHDFEHAGMILPPDKRDKFVALTNEENELEQRFVSNTAPAVPYIDFTVEQLRGLAPSHLKSIINRRKARLPTTGHLPQLALAVVENGITRRRIWEAVHTGRQDQIVILERLLRIRAQLAALTRFKTYAEAKLVDKMAKTPGALINILI